MENKNKKLKTVLADLITATLAMLIMWGIYNIDPVRFELFEPNQVKLTGVFFGMYLWNLLELN